MPAASDVRRFVIFTTPRTGSNMLCTMLDSHPEILCHHEIFNPQGIFYALPLRDGAFDLGSMEERDRDPAAFLEAVWARPLGHRCLGIKFNRRQNERAFELLLRDPAIRKIVLRRRNRVRSYVSYLIAERTGQWEVYDEADLVRERPRVEVRPRQLLATTETYRRHYRLIAEVLEATGQGWLELTYEELREPAAQRRALRYLGVDSDRVPLEPGSVRQNPGDLRRQISNFGELEAALRGTDLEADLIAPDP